MRSFSPYRFAWAQEIYKCMTVPILKEIWPNAEIDSMEELRADKSKRLDPRIQRLDFSGLDIVVNLHDEFESCYHISQRYRSKSNPDYSLRYKTAGKQGARRPAEYFRLKEAVENNLYRPNLYIMGLVNFTQQTKASQFLNSSFRKFHILRVDLLISDIKSGRIRIKGPWRNLDLSSGIYFNPNDIPKDTIFFEIDNQETTTNTNKTSRKSLSGIF